MDAPICAFLGAMALVLQKLDSVMASGNTLLEEGVRNQLDLLIGGLNEINTTLVDISEAEFPPWIAKIWMQDVRDLSYDLQDYFELTIHSGPGASIDPNKARTAGKRSGLLKIPLLHNRRLKKPSSSPLATKIMEFSARVQQACQARVRYGLHQLTLERRFVCYGPRLPSLQDSLIIDHGSVDEIEKCLATDDGNKQLKVISIVGSAGVGKTTLAKRLYNKHRGAFQFRAFVRVSPYPDMRRLLTSLFVQIHKQQPQIDWDANNLIDKIAQHLKNKRYFIIIDDLWDASVWDIVYRAFPKVSGCSRVITTTQVEDVALACSSYLSNNKFKIGPLDEKHSAELFFSKVFGCEDDCPTEFKEISYEIIRQCGGLPLSTINTAGMLASEPGFLMEQWKHIQHSLCPSSMTNASELLVHLKESQLEPSAEQSISRDTMVNSPVEEIDLMEDLFKSLIEDTPFMSAEDETGLKEARSKYPVKDSRVEFGRKQMDHWSNNETDLQYTSLRTDHTSERMKKVINLVYHYLPPHLKTCLLYLNMYPADYMIRKDDVVKQWVAEDFISSVEGQDREEVSRTYFDELINRGMLQAVDTDCNDQVLSCTVHHMILDLIAYKSMEDNFITIVDYFQRSLGVLDMGRRLSVQFGGAKSADVPAGIRISEVRSLMFFGFIKCVPSIVQYRLLRVLVFHVWADEDNMSFDLDRISELFLLRYLKIAGNIRVKLPEKMEQLRFLETLEVDARVNDVPLDIFLLKSLLHLRLPGGFVWPDEFGGMKSLLTLGYYDLTSNSEDNIENLGQLTSLRDLHLTCSTVTNENSLEKNIKFLASVLGKLSNLRSVSMLHAGSSHAYTPDVTGSDRPTLGVSFDGLSNVSPVPTFLQRLELSRHYCIFSSLPRWIKETNCLQVLNITIKELLRDDINVLKRLSALTALSLYIQGESLERIVFGNEGFSVLKYLKLVTTTTVPWLIFETGEMPNLRKLKLGFNAHRVDGHGSAPINIGHLTGAKEISVKICCTSVDDVKTALSASVINNDPRNPRINVQLVDWKFYTGGGTNLSTKAEPDDVITNSDEYDVDADEAPVEDESDQAVITDSGPWKHSSRMPAQGKGIRKEEQRPQKRLPEDLSVNGRCPPPHRETATHHTCVTPQNIRPLQFIRTELEMIAASFDDVHLNSQRQLLEKWILQLQDLVYDIEDFVDMNNCLLHKRPGVHANVLSDFRDRLKRLSKESPRWIIESAKREDSAPLSRPLARSLSTSSVGDELVGIQDKISDVLELVRHKDGQPGLRVISVVGCPGVGKTTLAKALYDQEYMRTMFDARVWVPASECSTAIDLLILIIKQAANVYPAAAGKSTSDDLNMMVGGTIVQHLQNILKLVRLLIIIDDLSLDHSKVKELKSVLDITSTNVPSLIIVTTSIQLVANSMNNRRRKGVYRMQGLGHRESRDLFCRSALGRAEGSLTPDQEYALEETLRRCDGLPLAVINAAGIWREQGWMEKFDGYQPVLYGAFEKMNRALLRWYKNRGLATFMLSLSIFPSGYLIKKNSVVRKWAAEGLILGEDGDYDFTELIDQFVIEPVLTGNNSKVKRCVVRGPLFEFIVRESISNNFVTLIRGEEPSSALPEEKRQNTARVLSVHGTLEIGRVEEEIRLGRIRSLTIFDGKAFDFQGCTYLRVLDLEGCKGVDDGVVAGICKLKLLRYLSLRGSDVLVIPKKIKNLECLQTLDIRETAVNKLPMEAIMLPQLVHLFGQFELPQELGERTKRNKLDRFFREESKLQTLSGLLITGKCNGYEHIALHLRLLRKIKIRCKHDTVSRDSGSLLMSSLQELLTGRNQLKSLSIDFGDGNMGEYFADYFYTTESIYPCMLSSIKLRGRLDRLPDFITSPFYNLSELQLSSSGLPFEVLSTLQRLRHLLYLKLAEDFDGLQGDNFVVEEDGFSSLRRLCFEAPKLPILRIIQGAMPALTSLHLLCPSFEDSKPTPYEWEMKYDMSGIEYLENLNELVLHSSVGDKELDFWMEKARMHMNRPRVTRMPSQKSPWGSTRA